MLAVFLLIYSAIAGRIERSLISGPIVFTAVGFILGADGLAVYTFKHALVQDAAHSSLLRSSLGPIETAEGEFASDSPLEEAGFELVVPPAIFCATATLSKPVFRTRLGAGGNRIRTVGTA
jgi:hypothetical protein